MIVSLKNKLTDSCFALGVVEALPLECPSTLLRFAQDEGSSR